MAKYPVATLTLYPPLRLRNLLCVPMQFLITEAPSYEVAKGVLPVGGSLPIFALDPNKKQHLSFRIVNYGWTTPMLVHNPKAPYPTRETVVTTELKRYTTSNILKQRLEALTQRIPQLTLSVALHKCDVSVYARTWIANANLGNGFGW